MSTTTFPPGWFNFDDEYLRKLVGNDVPTSTHFFEYFFRRLRIKASRQFDRKEDVDDIVGETFARVFDALHGGKLKDSRALPAFVLRVCEVIALEEGRKRKKFRQRHADLNMTTIISRAASQEDHAVDESNQRRAERAMNMLDAADRELLSRVINGEDNRSIAADLGISVEGIKSRKHRALREARRYFKDGQN